MKYFETNNKIVRMEISHRVQCYLSTFFLKLKLYAPARKKNEQRTNKQMFVWDYLLWFCLKTSA